MLGYKKPIRIGMLGHKRPLMKMLALKTSPMMGIAPPLQTQIREHAKKIAGGLERSKRQSGWSSLGQYAGA